MWLLGCRNARNIVEASGEAFVEGKFGSFLLDQKWIIFKLMSSWEKYRFLKSDFLRMSRFGRQS